MAAGRIITAVVALGLVLAACGSDQTTRDDAGVIIEGGDLGVFSATAGDCVNVPDGDQIAQFEGVACTEPHDAQIYAAFDLPGDTFPGLESIRTDADEGCADRWESFFEIDYAASEYYSTRVTPTEESWNQIDDREVLCLVTSGPSGKKLTSDLRGYGADIVQEQAADEDVDATDDSTDDASVDTGAEAGDSSDGAAIAETLELVVGAGPTVVMGTLAAGSPNMYDVVMEAGQSIGVTLSTTDATSSISDPVLVVVDAAGNEVAANDDADGFNSGLIYTAAANGTFTILAGELFESAGDYELAVELVAAGSEPSIGQTVTDGLSEAAGEQVAALTVAPGGTISTTNTLASGTYDIITLTVDAPVSATVTVTGDGSLDTQVVVLSGGEVIAENDDASPDVGLPSVLDSQVVVDLAAGEFEIQVRSFGDFGAGDYTLEVVGG